MIEERTFKYKDHLGEILNCPPSNYTNRDFVAYRLVHKDMNHKNNFLPIRLINPERKLSPEHAKCMGYGLSFYDTLSNIRDHFNKLRKRNKRIHLTIGTHIAEGHIQKIDGVASLANKDGHITFHEFSGFKWSERFIQIEEVYHD